MYSVWSGATVSSTQASQFSRVTGRNVIDGIAYRLLVLFSQRRLNVSDGLGGLLKENAAHAKLMSGGDVPLDIIHKDRLCWPHTQAFAGQLEDATIGLGDSLLMGI